MRLPQHITQSKKNGLMKNKTSFLRVVTFGIIKFTHTNLGHVEWVIFSRGKAGHTTNILIHTRYTFLAEAMRVTFPDRATLYPKEESKFGSSILLNCSQT